MHRNIGRVGGRRRRGRAVVAAALLATGLAGGVSPARATAPTIAGTNGPIIGFDATTSAGSGLRTVNVYDGRTFDLRAGSTGHVFDVGGMRIVRYDGATNQIVVASIEPDGVYRETVATPPSPGFVRAKDLRWSPDRRKVAFLGSVDGTTFDAFTLTVTTPASRPVRLSTGGAPSAPTWAADSLSVAYSVRVNGADHEIVTQRADGAWRTVQTSDRAQQIDPSWSRSGTALAYATNETGAWAVKQAAVRRDLFGFWRFGASGIVGSAPTPGATFTSTPVYSPDGGKLLASWSGTGIATYTPGAAGAAGYPWTSRTVGGSPAAGPVLWSPDGRRAAFVRGGEVFTIDLATGAAQQATTGGGATAVTSWQNLTL